MFNNFDLPPVNVRARRRSMPLPRVGMTPSMQMDPAMQMNPQSPSLPPQRPIPKGPGFMERMFPTPAGMEGLMSEDDLANARRQALLQFGGGLLADSGWHPKYGGPTLGQSMGKALGAAQEGYNSSVDRTFATQQAGQQARSQQEKQAFREQVERQFPPVPGETTDQTIARLEKQFAMLAPRDPEAAGKIGEVLKSYGRPDKTAAGKPEWRPAGGKQVFLNPDGTPVIGKDGKPMEIQNTPPARDPNAPNNAEVMREQRLFQREQGLADDFRKDTSTASASVYILADTLREADRAIAGDVAAQQRMMYGFINSMDNSAVRDGERAAVAAGAPLLQQAQVALSKLSTGDKSYSLPPAVLRAMKDLMTRRYHGSAQFIKTQEKRYQATAKRLKVPEERFVMPMPELGDAPDAGAPGAQPNFFEGMPQSGAPASFARPPIGAGRGY